MPISALKQHHLSRSCAGLLSRLAYERGMQQRVDLQPLLARARLTAADIQNPTARLSVASQIKFVTLLAEALGDPKLGFHLAKDFDLRRLEFLYYVATSADSLGAALRRLERYSVLANESIVVRVRKEKGVRIHLSCAGVARHHDQHQIEFVIATTIRLVRHLVRLDIKPTEVRIAHRRSFTTGEFSRFAGVRIRDNAGIDELSFAGRVWDLPVASADRYLHNMLVRCCEDALNRRATKTSPISVRIENEIAALLPHGQSQAEIVAARLGLSPRTLARRLAEENRSFTQVVRELRATLARRYLADRNLPISRIAWLLGYKEIGAFSHAFRRWTGMTPSELRRSVQSGGKQKQNVGRKSQDPRYFLA